MLCLIGESFDGESVLVNGAVVNVRNRVSYQFWHSYIVYVIFEGGQNIDVALWDQATGVCCQNRPDFEEATGDWWQGIYWTVWAFLVVMLSENNRKLLCELLRIK